MKNLILLMALFIFGCESFSGIVDFNGTEIDGFVKGETAQLNPPRDIYIEENCVVWSPIKGATGYVVVLFDSTGLLLDEKKVVVDESLVMEPKVEVDALTLTKMATVKIVSLGDKDKIEDSVEAFSFLTTATLPASVETSNVKPNALLPIPSEAQLEWQKLEQYAFIHFGPNTYQNMEWGFGKPSEGVAFKPTKTADVYTKHWVDEMKALDMNGLIFTAKHHDGFCLFQTKTTLYSLRNPKYSGGGNDDVVRDLAKQCYEADMKLGLYLSPGDRNNWAYTEEGYKYIFKEQVAELIEIAKSQQGENPYGLFEVWFDGANQVDGWFGGATMDTHASAPALPVDEKGDWLGETLYDYYPDTVNPDRLSRRGSEDANNKYLSEMKKAAMDQIYKQNERVVVFGDTIRWIGNEQGWAGRTHWSMGWDMYGQEEYGEWLPGEVDVKTEDGWFHDTNIKTPKSYKQLIEFWYRSVGRNANFLLNFSPTRSGLIQEATLVEARKFRETIRNHFKKNIVTDKSLLKSIETSNIRGNSSDFSPLNLIDENFDTYWSTDDSIVQNAQIVFNFNDKVSFNRVLLQEYIPLGQRVKEFMVEYSDSEKGDDWQEIRYANMPTRIHGDTNLPDETTTIGYKRILRTRKTEAKRVRITFIKNRDNYKEGSKHSPFLISEIGLYYAVD